MKTLDVSPMDPLSRNPNHGFHLRVSLQRAHWARCCCKALFLRPPKGHPVSVTLRYTLRAAPLRFASHLRALRFVTFIVSFAAQRAPAQAIPYGTRRAPRHLRAMHSVSVHSRLKGLGRAQISGSDFRKRSDSRKLTANERE